MNIYQGANYDIKGTEGTIKLIALSGFQSRLGAYSSIDGNEQSDGTVSLNIGGDMQPADSEITKEHLNTLNYLTDHQEEIRDALLSSLLSQYKELQEQYGYEDEEGT